VAPVVSTMAMAASGTCAACGKALEDRRRRYCSTVCKDRARRERVEAMPVATSEPVVGPAVAGSRGAHRGRILALGAVPFLAASGLYLLKRRHHH
jgi:hypothetical protein